MKLTDFERKIREMIPHANVETDNHGQLIIYTNLMMKDPNDFDSELTEFVPNQRDEDDDG